MDTRPLHNYLSRLIWICIIPLIALTSYQTYDAIASLKEHESQEAMQQLYHIKTAIDDQLAARIAALQLLASSPLAAEPMRRKEYYLEAQRFRRIFGGHVLLADKNTQMLFNTRVPYGESLPRLPKPSGYAAAPAVLQTGKPSTGDIFIGPIANENLVAIVVPVTCEGQTDYLLLNVIETRQFHRYFSQIKKPKSWVLKLTDSKNEIIAETAGGTSLGTMKHFQVLCSQAHWTVHLNVPSLVYYTPVIRLSVFSGLMLLLAILGGFFGGRLSARRLTHDIERLSGKPSDSKSLLNIAEIENVWEIIHRANAAKSSAEALLRENEEKFRNVFEAANVGKSITLPTGEINVNEAFCRMLGYRQSELAIKRWQDLTPPDDIEDIDNKLRPLLQGETDSARFIKRYIRKDLEIFWGDVSTKIQRDKEGHPIYFITTVIDVTDRLRAEEALRRSEENYHTLFKANPHPMWVYDLSTLRFLEVNDAAIEHYGYGRNEFLGMTIRDIRPLDDVPKLIDNLQHVSTGIDKAGVWRHIKKDGTMIFVEIISHTLDYDGHPSEVVLAQDVTERLKIEEAILALNESLEARIKERTAELSAKNEVLERLNRVFVDRELHMRELKERIRQLEQ